MLERVFSGHDLVDGWIHVQRDVYRYMIVQGTKTLVRSVIAEYLATEVTWGRDAQPLFRQCATKMDTHPCIHWVHYAHAA